MIPAVDPNCVDFWMQCPFALNIRRKLRPKFSATSLHPSHSHLDLLPLSLTALPSPSPPSPPSPPRAAPPAPPQPRPSPACTPPPPFRPTGSRRSAPPDPRRFFSPRLFANRYRIIIIFLIYRVVISLGPCNIYF